MFSLHMDKSIYLGSSCKNPDISIRFIDFDFLIGSEISAISGCFPLIFHQNSQKVRHISTFGLFYADSN